MCEVATGMLVHIYKWCNPIYYEGFTLLCAISC